MQAPTPSRNFSLIDARLPQQNRGVHAPCRILSLIEGRGNPYTGPSNTANACAQRA